MASFDQYFHTVIHLRPVQIYGRAAFQFNRPKPRFTSERRRAVPNGAWTEPAAKAQSLRGADEFCFLGRSGKMVAPGDWNDPAREKLWLYNLHYFDDLTADGAATRRAWHATIIDRWIAENPPCSGNGWEPYPTSLRIVNWIKLALTEAAVPDRWLDSLALQANWLERRLEWHLLGNHLFANAKALVFAGLFFDGADAMRWRKRGFRILESQLAEQVLADGGHFELSPMYHAIILEDLLDLINLARTFSGAETMRAVVRWIEISGRMRRWLAAMTHPDGHIAFFNDAAFGIAPEPAALDAYAARLELAAMTKPSDGVLHLPQSGYVRWQGSDSVALLDVAAIGPDHLPGHAHADSLSFELSVAGDRVIVNGGTSTYSNGPQRQRERGTAAHSTVTVDDADSSEMWAAFRVARRARIQDLSIAETNGAATVAASHDGYRRLGGGATHRRAWTLRDDSLSVRDLVSGRYQSAMARFHLNPDMRTGGGRAAGQGETRGMIEGKGRAVAWRAATAATIEPSQWHPEFGRTETACCVAVPIPAEGAVTVFTW